MENLSDNLNFLLLATSILPIDFEAKAYSEILRYGFIEVDVISGEEEGLIMFSPSGQEYYREIPVTEKWKENIITLILNDKNYKT